MSSHFDDITKLEGPANYHFWAAEAQAVLLGNNLWSAVDPATPVPSSAVALRNWASTDKKAFHLLYLLCSDQVQQKIADWCIPTIGRLLWVMLEEELSVPKDVIPPQHSFTETINTPSLPIANNDIPSPDPMSTLVTAPVLPNLVEACQENPCRFGNAAELNNHVSRPPMRGGDRNITTFLKNHALQLQLQNSCPSSCPGGAENCALVFRDAIGYVDEYG